MAKKKSASGRQPGVNKRRLVLEALAEHPDASPKELSDKFATNGIEIVPSYISNIKTSLKHESGPNGEGSPGEARLNVSQAIRDYFSENPRAKPKAAADALKQQHGMDFNTTTISSVKHQMKKAGLLGKRRSQSGVAARTGTDASGVGFDDLMAAKEMAQRLGGVEKARAAIDALSKLMN